MNHYLIAGIVLAATALLAFAIMGYWWWRTGGAWARYRAGRSLMGLLGILGAMVANSAVNALFFPGLEGYPGKPVVSTILYLLFLIALGSIGWAIHHEYVLSDRRAAMKNHPSSTDKEPHV